MSALGTYSAESAVRAVDGVNIELLEKPVFVHGLTFAILPGDRVVVDGLARRVSLRGRGIIEALDLLRELCDGSRSVTQVLEAVPSESFDQVRRVLALAVIRGLVAEHSEAPTTPVSNFVDRFLAETGRYQSGVQASSVADATSFAVRAPSFTRSLIELEFEDIGLRLVDEDPDITITVVAKPRELEHIDSSGRNIVVVDTGEMVAVASAGFSTDQPCLSCLAHQLHGLLRPTTEAAAPHHPFFLASTLATETLSLVLGYNTTQIIDRFIIGSVDYRQQYLHAKRRPTCQTCMRHEAAALTASAEAVFDFEELVGFGSRALSTPSAYLGHYQDANLKLARRTELFLTGDRIPIASARKEFGPAAAQAFDLAWQAVGVRDVSDDFVSRFAPTGGNIGSPVAYVATLESPIPQWYRIDPIAGDVIMRKPVSAEWTRWLQQTAGPNASSILFAADVSAVLGKYGPFAWKIIGLDSGAAIASFYGGAVLAEAALTGAQPPLDLAAEIGMVGGEVPMATFNLEGPK